jgi:hypothetical protein
VERESPPPPPPRPRSPDPRTSRPSPSERPEIDPFRGGSRWLDPEAWWRGKFPSVRFHISGVKRFHHSQVGDLELNYERLEVVFDTGLTISTYTADPGTRSADALALLGSLAATTAGEKPTPAP